ncbi:MAG: hypothetical protein ACYDH4_09565 [Candidatus Cryosericum sp.]
MNVRQLIAHLEKLDPKAEIMVDAPYYCSKGPEYRATGSLALPVRCLKTGIFTKHDGRHLVPEGKDSLPWVMLQGTDAWGLDQGVTSVG